MLASNRRSIDSNNNNNEALLTVIGFLEACAPRMLELIEIAAQGGGVLKDETFEECLLVNDKLTNILADLDDNNDSVGIGAASAAAAAAAATTAASAAAVGGRSGGEISTSDDSDAIDLGMQNISMCWGESGDGGDNHPDEVVGGKTSGLDDSEDLLGIGLDDHASSTSSGPPPPPNPFSSDSTTEAKDASSDNDDFDAFFRDRTVAP